MEAIVGFEATAQTLAATDTVSDASGMQSCGPYTYRLDPNVQHSFIELDASKNELIVESNNQSDIAKTPIFVTVFASLENYQTVLPAQLNFQINLIDICDVSSI